MKLFLLAIVATAVCALPNADYPDSVVPETGLVDTNAFEPAKAAQEAITVLLQEGKDEGACASLAAVIVDEVQNGVDTQQKILNALDNGSDCHNQGQDGVDAAQKSLDSATSALSDANKALADANNAPVTVAAPFSTLTEGQCDFFFSDSAYTSVKASFDTAKNEVQKAQGAKNGAVTALATAKEEQKAAVEQCLCDVRSAYNKAWKASNANNDENEKAYAKGKHMACVLAGTAPADCDVGEVPKVTAVSLADGVPEHHCASFGAIQSTHTQCAKMREQRDQYLDRQNVACAKNKAMSDFKVVDGCPSKDLKYKYGCMKADYGESTTTFTKKTSCQHTRNQKEHYLDRQNVDCGSGALINSFKLVTGQCKGDNMRYTVQCLRPESPLTEVSSHKTSCQTGVKKELQYLDRLKVACPAGKALQRFQMSTSGCSSSKVRYNFWCAK
jgi:hypothetical protein